MNVTGVALLLTSCRCCEKLQVCVEWRYRKHRTKQFPVVAFKVMGFMTSEVKQVQKYIFARESLAGWIMVDIFVYTCTLT